MHTRTPTRASTEERHEWAEQGVSRDQLPPHPPSALCFSVSLILPRPVSQTLKQRLGPDNSGNPSLFDILGFQASAGVEVLLYSLLALIMAPPARAALLSRVYEASSHSGASWSSALTVSRTDDHDADFTEEEMEAAPGEFTCPQANTGKRASHVCLSWTLPGSKPPTPFCKAKAGGRST